MVISCSADGNYPFKMWNDNQLIDSKRNNSDIQSYRAEINLQTAFTPKQDLQIKAYLYDSERGLPGGVIYDNPYSAERLYDKNYFGQFRYENRFSQQVKLQVAGKFNYSWNRDYNNESSALPTTVSARQKLILRPQPGTVRSKDSLSHWPRTFHTII